MAGHRCPEVGAWDQGEAMWIGIVGLWLGIRVRHLITIMCRRLKTTEYSTSPHQTLEPVCQNVMTAEGVPLTCTGVAQVLPLCYHFGSAGSDLVQKGLSCCFRFVGYFFQVKVFTESTFMELAVEQFLGKSEKDVKVDFSLTFLFRSFFGDVCRLSCLFSC